MTANAADSRAGRSHSQNNNNKQQQRNSASALEGAL
jgi:hypothetical protein